jgi:hypothetical protein
MACEGIQVKSIFVDRRVWRETADWISFESDPRLTITKKDIYARCVPCISNLYRSLREEMDEIEIGEAYRCWKVVAVLRSKEECLDVLRAYEERFLQNDHVKGKFGSGQASSTSKVLMFHTEDEQERDRLLEGLRRSVRAINPEAKVFYSRACANLYHDLLGDWRDWKEVTKVKRPELRPALIERIRKLLYWEKDG